MSDKCNNDSDLKVIGKRDFDTRKFFEQNNFPSDD